MKAPPKGPSPDRSEFELVVDNLKRILKLEKITYIELARALSMSESGIKKVLGAKDGSFQKLAAICRYVGVPMADLMKDSEQAMSEVSFTRAQQDIFLKDPLLFRFYFQLVYERVPLEDLEAQLKLSEAESFRFLRQLDTLGLLKLHPGRKIQLPRIKQVRWVGEGPLVEHLYQEWGHRMMNALAKPRLERDKLFILRSLKMKRETYGDFLAAQKELEKAFVARAVQEMRMNSKGLVDMTWVVGVASQGFFAYR